MKISETMLTAEEYNTLYCKAFARLDEICCLAQAAMEELEQLQLAMGDADESSNLIPFPRRWSAAGPE